MEDNTGFLNGYLFDTFTEVINDLDKARLAKYRNIDTELKMLSPITKGKKGRVNTGFYLVLVWEKLFKTYGIDYKFDTIPVNDLMEAFSREELEDKKTLTLFLRYAIVAQEVILSNIFDKREDILFTMIPKGTLTKNNDIDMFYVNFSTYQETTYLFPLSHIFKIFGLAICSHILGKTFTITHN